MPYEYPVISATPPDVDLDEDILVRGDTIPFITKMNRRLAKFRQLIDYVEHVAGQMGAFGNALNQTAIASNGLGMGRPVDKTGITIDVSISYGGQFVRLTVSPYLAPVAEEDATFEVALWNDTASDMNINIDPGVTVKGPQAIIGAGEVVIAKPVAANTYILIGAKSGA